MGILDNRSKNDIDEYKKILSKYKQVLDMYRREQDTVTKQMQTLANSQLQTATSTQASDDANAQVSNSTDSGTQTATMTQSSVTPVEALLSTAELHIISERMDSFDSGIKKIDSDLDAIANKLELIDNSFSDYVYSDPVTPEINFDEVLDKLNSVQAELAELIEQAPEPVRTDPELIEHIKHLNTIPNITSRLDTMNVHFLTVVNHLNKITDYILRFENEVSKTRIEVDKFSTSMQQNEDAILTSKNEIMKKLSDIENAQNRSKESTSKLTVIMVISLLLNVVLLASHFLF